MEWSDLRIFLAIARAGTLGAAARQAGLTQPTMGRRLRALEQAVGQTLFQRTSDGMVLTDEGQSVLAHAERMEEEAIALERQLAGRGGQLSGLLRVSCSDWFGSHVLAPVLAHFASLHPGVTIELLTEARLLSLARREADLVFRIRPFEEPEVVQRRLMHMAYGLYAPVGMDAPVAGDGTGCPLVTMDTGFGGMPDVAWLQRMLPRARIAFRSNNRDVQARMCARGVGLAVLPRLLADGMAGLYPVDLGEPPPGRDVWLGYHRDLRRLGRLRALLALVIERLGS
ncbi:MAG TPA: LysR family transcriptional regulator [Geminicoccus sp.]|jgi:DNA-binding transcriptional LysR family regulator|uniref:LysR family transcriptional regulator n=1 Tax=Geminicoccus sp. TaxID=2024832 RepID=UPI002E32D0D2|nr:LysR family transcriptional regulator [Geminicoccus sp.]HEX2527570.1 LysR family transcriptional regulator [Geminicoccus sp.]